MKGRNPDYNPYRNDWWYVENMEQWEDGSSSGGGSGGSSSGGSWDDATRAIEDMWGADESMYLVGAKASILAAAVASFI